MLDLASAPTWKTLYERESKLIEGFKSVATLPHQYKEKVDLYRLRTIIWKVIHNIKFDLLNYPLLEVGGFVKNCRFEIDFLLPKALLPVPRYIS